MNNRAASRMKVSRSSEAALNFYMTIWLHIAEGKSLDL
jgi:hypothetical protein